jgi:hypothetical protein
MKIVVKDKFILDNNTYLTNSLCWSFGVIQSNEEVEQRTCFYTCRDYLGEIVYASHTGQTLRNITYNPTTTPIEKEYVCLIMNFGTPVKKRNFVNHIKELHAIEEKNGWQLTDLTECDNGKIVICGDKRWMANLFLFSVYTFLLKVLCNPYKDTWETGVVGNESVYYQRTADFFPWILNNLETLTTVSKDTITGYPQEETLLTNGWLHGYAGFVYLITNKSYSDKIRNTVSDFIYSIPEGELLSAAARVTAP